MTVSIPSWIDTSKRITDESQNSLMGCYRRSPYDTRNAIRNTEIFGPSQSRRTHRRRRIFQSLTGTGPRNHRIETASHPTGSLTTWSKGPATPSSWSHGQTPTCLTADGSNSKTTTTTASASSTQSASTFPSVNQAQKTSTSHSGRPCAKVKESTQSISLLAWCVT